MSTYSSNCDRRRYGGLYRDRENGWIFGVCAGLAEYANFRTGTVRILALIGLLLFFWPAVLLYGAATLLLKDRPLIYTGNDAEYEFWRCRGHRGRWTHS